MLGITILSFQVEMWFFKIFFYIALAVSPISIFLLLVAVMDLIFKSGDYFATKYFDDQSRFSLFMIISTCACSVYGLIKLFAQVSQNTVDHVPVWIFLGLSLTTIILTVAKLNSESKVQNTLPYLFVLSVLLYLYTGSNPSLERTVVSKAQQMAYYFMLFVLGSVHISLIDSANQDYQEVNSVTGPDSGRGYEMANTTEDSHISSGNNDTQRPQSTAEDAEALKLFRKQTLIFHCYMMVMGLLSVALLQNWRYDSDGDITQLDDVRSKLGYHVQFAAYCMGGISLIWNLVAPYFFPDRDFS